MTIIIETERLILRTWKEEDAAPYFQINQDPKVIEFLRGSLCSGQLILVTTHTDKNKMSVNL